MDFLNYISITETVIAGLIIASVLAFCNYTIKFVYKKIKRSKQKRYKRKIESDKQNTIKKLKTARKPERKPLFRKIKEYNIRLTNISEALQEKQNFIISLKASLKQESNEIEAKKITEAITANRKGDFSKTDALFEELENREGITVERATHAAFVRGQIAEQDIRWRDAAEHYARAAHLYPCFDTLIKAQKLTLDIGNYSSALSFAMKAKEAAIKEYGEDTEQYAHSLNNLGLTYDKQGQYDKAEPLYQKASKICKKVFEKKNPRIAININNLARMYQKQGRYDEAETLYKQALNGRKEAWGVKHYYTAQSLNNLAEFYTHTKQPQKALPLYEEALKICRKTLGKKNPDIATILGNMGNTYDIDGNYKKIESIHKEALLISQETLGDTHPDVAKSLNNLACFYSKINQHKEAEPLYEQAIEILESNFDSDHPITKKIKDNYNVGKYNRLVFISNA